MEFAYARYITENNQTCVDIEYVTLEEAKSRGWDMRTTCSIMEALQQAVAVRTRDNNINLGGYWSSMPL